MRKYSGQNKAFLQKHLLKGALSSVLCIATLFLSSTVFAQSGAGTLVGTVKNASDETALVDVVVTVTSPSLQGEEFAVTDDTGKWRINALPPGMYSVTLEGDGFQPFTRDEIPLRSDVTLKVDANLLPDGLIAEEEEIMVTAPPVVDVGNTQVQTTISKEFTKNIPVSANAGGSAVQSFEDVAALVAPAAKSDTYGTSLSGTTSPENNFMIDGVTVNSTSHGTNSSALSMDFIEEVNVISGGYMPEHGRSTGGIMNVVTKSGGNEFHGSAYLRVNPGKSMMGEQKIAQRLDTSVQTVRNLDNQTSVGFDFGGPLIKDKLWFFIGGTMGRTSYALDRSLHTINGEQISLINGSEKTYNGVGYNAQMFAKLTWRIMDGQKLSASVFSTPQQDGWDLFNDRVYNVGTASIRGDYDALVTQNASSSLSSTLKWTGAFLNRHILADATLGYVHQNEYVRANDGSKAGDQTGLGGKSMVRWQRNRNPGLHSLSDFEDGLDDVCKSNDPSVSTLCPVSSYFTGGPGFLQETQGDSLQLNSSVSFLFDFLGHHVVKTGVSGAYTSYLNERGYTGRRFMSETTSGSWIYDARQYGYLTSPDEAVILDKFTVRSHSAVMGGYLQDSWDVFDTVTVNYGVRYDAQYLFNGQGELAMALPNQFSPRLGVVYDPTQEGKGKVFANYARFYQNVPLAIADRASSGEPGLVGYRRAKNDANPEGCDPTTVEGQQGSACRGDDSRANLTGPNAPTQTWFVQGGTKTPVDPDLQAPSSDEVVVGGEYELLPETRFGASYTKRWVNSTIEDMSNDEATTYFIGNPGFGMGSAFPKAVRDFDAMTAYVSKAYADDWMFSANYTLSFLQGNWSGLYRPENGQLDPNLNSDFDLASLMANKTGFLPGDSRHNIKFFAAKGIDLPMGMRAQLGTAIRAISGGPTNYYGAHEIYGQQEAYVLPQGVGERLPWRVNADVNAALEVKVWKTNFKLGVDVFNVFNFQSVTAVDQIYTRSAVLPIINGKVTDLPNRVTKTDGSDFVADEEVNKNFGRPTQYQAPRSFQFTLRGAF